MTKIIGLTGGIGSGKTTVANYFKAAGVPVYIADDAARNLMQAPEIVAKIKTVFGTAIFDGTTLNRQKLAEIVFNNSKELKKLNEIIHPAVKKHFEDWVLNQKHPFVIYETAILFESGSYKNCNQIITVTAPVEERIRRVMARDDTTREQVIKRMDAQWNDEQRIAGSNFVIDNTTIATAKLEVFKILNFLNI